MTATDYRSAWLTNTEALESAKSVGSRKGKGRMYDSELETFKRSIDIRSYAVSHGYQLDRKQSWQGSSVMRHAHSDDKIVVKRGMDGHFVYFSVRDESDNGSIIDFVQNRLKISLGAVRKELRPWIGEPPVAVPSFAALPKTSKDRGKVEAAYAGMHNADSGHPYLENERGIPRSLIALPRFEGRIRIDQRGNAVFPHFDQSGLSGFELKNVGFTGFASGGSKALWLSNEAEDDMCLVIAESAIDALSHAVLFPDGQTRYASIGGKPNPLQPELIRAAAERLPLGSQVISAMDADADGAVLTEVVRKAVALAGRSDLRFTVHEPFGYKDLNDQLRALPKTFSSYRPTEITPG